MWWFYLFGRKIKCISIWTWRCDVWSPAQLNLWVARLHSDIDQPVYIDTLIYWSTCSPKFYSSCFVWLQSEVWSVGAESICKFSKSKIFTRQRCSRARLSLFAFAWFDFEDNGRDGDDAGGDGSDGDDAGDASDAGGDAGGEGGDGRDGDDAGDAGGDDNGGDGALMI